MKYRIICLLVLISILATLIPLAPVDTTEARGAELRCYIISFTQVQPDDTWRGIANHWGMNVTALRRMNPGVRLVRGTWVKIAVWIGCPRP